VRERPYSPNRTFSDFSREGPNSLFGEKNEKIDYVRAARAHTLQRSAWSRDAPNPWPSLSVHVVASPVAGLSRARHCHWVGGLTAHSFAGRNGAFQREYLLKHTAEGASSETQIDQVNDDCTRQLRVLLAAGLLAAP